MGRTAKIMSMPNAMPRQKWVERIVAAWREQVTSIFETGNLLEAAHDELKANGNYGEWIKMINDELPFGRSMVNKLISIASNDSLRNAEHVPHLPAQWGTLYALTHLTPEQFSAGIKSGAINPKMERKHVNELRGIEPKERKKKEVKSLTLDEWCFSFSEQITDAFALLKKPDAQELLEHLKGIIIALEETNGR